MKKYLIVLAAVLVALAGCKKNPEVVELTGLSFKQSELNAIVGDSIRLALVGTPAEAPLPNDIKWTSSNDEVVEIVDQKGNIAIVGPGEANITAKSGELSAVCKITARLYEVAWAPTRLTYFPSTISQLPVSDSVYQFEYPSGIYECQLFSVTIIAANSVEFAGFQGAGEGLMGDASVLFITKTPEGKEDFLGEAWDWVGFNIVTDEEVNETQFGIPAGEIDPEIVGQAELAYLQSIDAGAPAFDKDLYASGVYGLGIHSLEIEGQSVSYYSTYDGIVTSGHVFEVYDDETGQYAYTDYDITVQWCYGFDGLAFNREWVEGQDPYADLLIQPFELALSDPYHYVTGQDGVVEESVEPEPEPAPLRRLAPRKVNKGEKINLGQGKELKLMKYSAAVK